MRSKVIGSKAFFHSLQTFSYLSWKTQRKDKNHWPLPSPVTIYWDAGSLGKLVEKWFVSPNLNTCNSGIVTIPTAQKVNTRQKVFPKLVPFFTGHSPSPAKSIHSAIKHFRDLLVICDKSFSVRVQMTPTSLTGFFLWILEGVTEVEWKTVGKTWYVLFNLFCSLFTWVGDAARKLDNGFGLGQVLFDFCSGVERCLKLPPVCWI